MRNLSAEALNKIATKLGTEPIVIVEVNWGSGASLYADRTVNSVPGRIQEVSGLDNVVNVSNSSSSQEISVVLDDTDGSIKAVMDRIDIHKKDARVYQWFDGLDLEDRFLLFSGKISSPIIWSERDRTVTFSIISQIEDREVGFSAEEGAFDAIPNELIGKPWPMIFGHCIDVPAMQFNHAVEGSTLCQISSVIGGSSFINYPDGSDEYAQDNGSQAAEAGFRKSVLDCAKYQFQRAASLVASTSPKQAAQWNKQADDFREQINEINSQLAQQSTQQEYQKRCARQKRSTSITNAVESLSNCNPITVLGGEDFPQEGGLKVLINGAILTGHFEGDKFHWTGLEQPDLESDITEQYNDVENVDTECQQFIPNREINLRIKTPLDSKYDDCSVKATIISTAWAHPKPKPPQVVPSASHVFQADAGSKVSIYGLEPITYVVSIVPGTVLAVKAYKKMENTERKLVNVPDELWEVTTASYGPVSAVQVVLTQPLSTLNGQEWEDDLYVTFSSSVGPNTCSILAYLITNYTDLTYDGVTFNHVASRLSAFPMNFPLLTRKNTIAFLQEIAFQARCALWLSNGCFYIKYLPEAPTSVSTITRADIDSEAGIDVEMTPTEDLVTKMTIRYRISWAEDASEKTLILRHNVAKYGTQAEEYDFYCFNQPDVVYHVATFWLIRLSNTWKRVKFKTFLSQLNLETFDTVTLDLDRTYVDTGPTRAMIEQADYNSDDQTIDFTCLTPVKSGSMSQYGFFWPADVSTSETFPTAEEIALNYAGGGSPNMAASGALPIGFTGRSSWGSGIVWVGGPNVIYGPNADWGSSTPSDSGFTAQSPMATTVYANISTAIDSIPGMYLNYVAPVEKIVFPELPPGAEYFDIRSTGIYDSGSNKYSTLDTFFYEINEDGKLSGKTDALFNDETNEAEFDFKYDEEGAKFGAGTAFLKASEDA